MPRAFQPVMHCYVVRPSGPGGYCRSLQAMRPLVLFWRLASLFKLSPAPPARKLAFFPLADGRPPAHTGQAISRAIGIPVESIGGGCDWGIGGLRGVEPGARGGSLIREPGAELSGGLIGWVPSAEAGQENRCDWRPRRGGMGAWVGGCRACWEGLETSSSVAK